MRQSSARGAPAAPCDPAVRLIEGVLATLPQDEAQQVSEVPDTEDLSMKDFLATLNVSVRTLLNGIKLEIEAAGVPVHFP